MRTPAAQRTTHGTADLGQLPLAIRLDDGAVFETFFAQGNEASVDYLESLCRDLSGPGAWLCGAEASGKSHLLQAVCARVGEGALYLPLAELLTVGPTVLEGAATRRCVCLDDLEVTAEVHEWERALFALYEAVVANGTPLVVAANAPQRQVSFKLADLASRFSLLPTFALRPLGDEGRIAALMLRARQRGLELPEETARFLTTRARRDMASLYSMLDRLDEASLIAKRRLTIPFVKEVFDE